MPMEPSIAQGVAVELDYLINEGWRGGWQFEIELDGFRIVPPPELAAQADFDSILREYVWNVGRFIAYSQYFSIEKTKDGGYIFRSQTDTGNGFFVIFEPKNRNVIKPYTRSKN
jgi:hypothetical protein